MLSIEELLGLSGPIGLLCALCLYLPEIQRHMACEHRAQFLTGGIFGLVAMLQMALPIEVHPGVLIDLRNLPVVLAGAFLGWRGLVSCLLVAMTTRLAIGGTGMFSGLLSMLVAGYVGAIWDRATLHSPRRNSAQLLLLGVMSTASFLGILFLPTDMFWWVAANVLPVMTLVCLILVPATAFFVQKEVLRAERHRSLPRRLIGNGAEGSPEKRPSTPPRRRQPMLVGRRSTPAHPLFRELDRLWTPAGGTTSAK